MINLIQISDPHIGQIFDHAGAAFVSGYNSHDIKLCEALAQWLDEDVWDIDGISEENELFLIMNGDLTSRGLPREFEVADTYLFSHQVLVRNGRTRHIGLNHSVDNYAGIAGNHDHWHGRWVWPNQRGYSREVYDSFFQPLPFVSDAICADGIEIRVFAIDSCSMFEESLLNLNPLAVGGFSKKHRRAFQRCVIETLKQPLAQGCSYRAAVILCHHPFSKDGPAGPLRTRCANWLGRLAVRYGVRLVLAGHTHRTWTNTLEVTTPNGSRRVREVRCPTTLQYPARLDTSHRSPGLWLHQISTENDEIVWKGTLLLYSSGSFQTPVEELPSEERLQRKAWFEERIPPLNPSFLKR